MSSPRRRPRWLRSPRRGRLAPPDLLARQVRPVRPVRQGVRESLGRKACPGLLVHRGNLASPGRLVSQVLTARKAKQVPTAQLARRTC